MKDKLAAACLAAAAIFTLTACGDPDEKAEAAAPTLTPREQACESLKKIPSSSVFFKFDEVTLADPSAPSDEYLVALKRQMDFMNDVNQSKTPLTCTGPNFARFEDMLATDVDFQDWVRHMVNVAASESASATPTP